MASDEATAAVSGRPTRGEYHDWTKVAVLWASAVGAFALILYLLTAFQLEQLRRYSFEQAATALRNGEVRRAAAYLSDDYSFFYPTSLVVQFAALGLAVITTAWLGRRALAAALPFAIVVTSLAPSYWGEGPWAPQPLGEGDRGLWGSLSGIDGFPMWPFLLGSLVQLSLLLLPLVAAPRVSAALPSMDAVFRALVPGAVLALIALAAVPSPSGQELWRAPLTALLLTALVTMLFTGDRPLVTRVAAAILVPAGLVPILLSTSLDNQTQGVGMTLAVAGGAALVLLLTAAMRWLQTRVRPVADPVPA
ncbi:MAG: hypothetical protein ABI720_02935 [Actinomycetes bacterium]